MVDFIGVYDNTIPSKYCKKIIDFFLEKYLILKALNKTTIKDKTTKDENSHF